MFPSSRIPRAAGGQICGPRVQAEIAFAQVNVEAVEHSLIDLYWRNALLGAPIEKATQTDPPLGPPAALIGKLPPVRDRTR